MSDKFLGNKSGEEPFAPPFLDMVYDRLFFAYGPQGWWPLVSRAGLPGFDEDGYHPSVVYLPDFTESFEIAAGAVLVQNTAWKNASLAVRALVEAGLMLPERLCAVETEELYTLVRSSGYFRQKALRLKELAAFFMALQAVPSRDELLGVKGIGRETADSILLYGFDRPYFVVDAYTRRIFFRLGILDDERMDYDTVSEAFMLELDRDTELYREYHALIVEHAKRHCRKKPDCYECPLTGICRYFKIYAH